MFAVLWIVAKFVTFRTSRQRGLMLHDLIDCMRGSKWKLHQSPSRSRRVGNYLTLPETTWRPHQLPSRHRRWPDGLSRYWERLRNGKGSDRINGDQRSLRANVTGTAHGATEKHVTTPYFSNQDMIYAFAYKIVEERDKCSVCWKGIM